MESSDSTTDNEHNVRGKKIERGMIYKQKFKMSWLTKPEFKMWLMQNLGTGLARCKLCECDLAGSITQIKRHSQSKKHLANIESLKNERRICDVFEFVDARKEKEKQQRFNDSVRAAELKIVISLAEHSIPFTVMDHLPEMIKCAFPDSNIAKAVNCSRTKAAYLMKNAIAEEEREDVIKVLRASYFSLIIDESTDIDETTHLVMLARLYDTKLEKVVDMFIALIEVGDATSAGLFNSVESFFKENKIPISNVIGFASDNCNVMMGKKNGFVALLQKKIPHLYYLGCICHSFHLCASSACEKLPKDVEKLTINICNYIRGSPKRIRDLKEFQEFCELQQSKILKLASTRWLSHEAVIHRIVTQWKALLLFFQDQALGGNNKDAKGIMQAMNNSVFKAYFLFLNYILPLIKKLNLQFQSEGVKVHTLLNSVAFEFKVICKNFLKKEYLVNREVEDIVVTPGSDFLLPLPEVYLGARVEQLILNGELSHVEVVGVKTACRDYYIQLCLEIQQRIDFKDPVLKAVKNLNPEIALSGQVRSLIPLAFLFPHLISDEEWRILPLHVECFVKTDDPENFCGLLLKRKYRKLEEAPCSQFCQNS